MSKTQRMNPQKQLSSSQLKIKKNKKEYNKIIRQSTNNILKQQFQFHLDQQQPQTLNAKRKLQQFSQQVQFQQIIQSKKRLNYNYNQNNHKRNNKNSHINSTRNGNKNNNIHNISKDNTGWIETQDINMNMNINFNNNMSMNNNHYNNNYRKQSTSPTRMSHYQQRTQSAKFRSLKTQGNQLKQNQNQNQNYPQKNIKSRSKFRETMRFKSSSQMINVHQKKFSLDIKNTNKVNFNFSNLNNIKNLNNINSNNNRRQLQLTKHIKTKHKSYRPYSSSSISHKIIMLQKNNQNQNNQINKNSNKYTQKNIIHSKNNNNNCQNNCYYQNNKNNQNDKLMSLLNQTKNLFLKTKTMNYWTGKKINNNNNNRSYSDNKIKQTNQQVINKQTNINTNINNKQTSKTNNISNQTQQNSPSTTNQPTSPHTIPQQPQINPHLFQTPIDKKYQNDYQLLQKMLKYQSKNILDNQLHSYLTHMKNKYQSNFYYSSAIFNKVKPKKANNYIFNMNMNKKQDSQKQYQNINSPVKKLKHIKNNTSLHYAPLSASKHKKQFMSTSLSYNNNQQKVYNM